MTLENLPSALCEHQWMLWEEGTRQKGSVNRPGFESWLPVVILDFPETCVTLDKSPNFSEPQLSLRLLRASVIPKMEREK